MAKTKQASDKQADNTKVTRITAADSGARQKMKAGKTKYAVAEAKKLKQPNTKTNQPSRNPFVSLGRYFKGAWIELRQVHWPTRRATWSLTGAVLVFTAIFVVMILALDYVFNLLFEMILR